MTCKKLELHFFRALKCLPITIYEEKITGFEKPIIIKPCFPFKTSQLQKMAATVKTQYYKTKVWSNKSKIHSDQPPLTSCFSSRNSRWERWAARPRRLHRRPRPSATEWWPHTERSFWEARTHLWCTTLARSTHTAFPGESGRWRISSFFLAQIWPHESHDGADGFPMKRSVCMLFCFWG